MMFVIIYAVLHVLLRPNTPEEYTQCTVRARFLIQPQAPVQIGH